MGGVHAGESRIHKAHKVGAHLMLGFFMKQAYTVHAGLVLLFNREGAASLALH
jgi:hypothetical protein